MARGTRTVSEAYAARVASGELTESAAQTALADELSQLQSDLERDRPTASGRGLFGWLRGRTSVERVRGLYVWGGVGRGKTMLMDMFFAEVAIRHKKRIHFHAFMNDVHERIAKARSETPGDPVPVVAADIGAGARLLCFDELHVTDITDAMILGRLFRALWETNTTVVATSNVPPDGLYKDGLNRNLFVPFIDLIKTHMAVHHFDAETDYRLQKLAGERRYFTPLGEATLKGMDALWDAFTDGEAGPGEVRSLGRSIPVPQARDGVARFSFDDLCEQPLGSRDYLAIARQFHTLFIDDVPQLGPEKRNAARRFINLVDTLYDARIGLVMSAETEPDEIYVSGDGRDLFGRTASRLIEMRSEAYLADRDARIAAIQSARSDKLSDATA